MAEWQLDPSSRQVRCETPIKAPCGCSDEDQYSFSETMSDWSPSYIECVGCGATWECFEGGAWEYFEDDYEHERYHQ